MRWLDSLFRDFRFSLRQLARSAVFTVVAGLTLALGIGANTAVFTFINAVILRNLPVREPGRLVAVYRIGRNDRWAGITVGQIEEIQRQQRVFSAIFGRSYPNGSAVQVGDRSVPINLGYVTGDYYSVLGIKPLAGRLLDNDDVGLPNGRGSPVAVISHDFWQEHYGGALDTIGKRILIGQAPFTVVGITPKGFFGEQVGFSLDFTIPVTQRPDRGSDANGDLFCQYLVGRLQDGVGIDQARAQLETIWPGVRSITLPSNLNPRSREAYLGYRLRVERYPVNGFSFLRDQFSKPLQMLMAISALVFLITCLNLATLQLARGSARQKEVGVRMALGAAPRQIMRQLLMESFLLSVLGAALGLVFAYWACNRLVHFWNTGIGTVLDLRPDGRVLGFTMLSAIVTAILFGVIPAWRICRQAAGEALKEGASNSGRAMRRFGKMLIVAQVALSVVAVASGGLLVRSFVRLRAIHPGFDYSHILALELQPSARGRSKSADSVYCTELVNALSGVPGVRSVALSHMLPGSGFGGSETVAPEAAGAATSVSADFQQVSPEFFQTMNIPLVTGRDFRWRDDAQSPRVAIISRGLAQRLFPSDDAIGRRIRIGAAAQRQQIEVVGVVKDSRLRDIRQPWPFIVYVPYVQEPGYISSWTDVELQVAGSSPKLLEIARQRIESLGREYVRRSQTIDQVIETAVVNERVMAFVSGFFAGLALLLAAIGLYGLMSHAVRQRTREIGIRMAVGARSTTILWMVLRETLLLILTGLVIGLAGAFASARFIVHMLVDLSPYDPVTIILVVVELVAVGLIAGILPARWAADRDPVTSLRYQ